MLFLKNRFLIIGLLILCASPLFATIQVHVDPHKIQLGDTFRLTLTMAGPQTNGVPDLTLLQKDFSILGSERSMSYTLINGQATSMNQWTVLLRPKKAGTITIPAIPIGQQASKTTTIEVSDNPNADEASQQANDSPVTNAVAKAVLIKTDVGTKHPYVNQAVTYRVKLYSRGQLLDAQYQPPKVKDSLLILLGDVDRYSTVENGQSYMVEEQQYAVFPEKSGTLRIAGPAFRALVYDTIPERVSIPSKSTPLQVKPIPPSFTGKTWLPSRHVELDESYDQLATTLSQGSTLVRTVTLRAKDVPGQLLPTLAFPGENQPFSVYPDKAETHNRINKHTLMGEEEVNVTYLLNQAGNITLPEIRIPWFNTVTEKEEVAILPARTLIVTASQATQKPPASTPSTTASVATEPTTDLPTQAAPAPVPARPMNGWLLFLAVGFGLAWVVTLLLWWRQASPKASWGKRQSLKRLKQACQKHEAVAAQRALLAWAKLQWPEHTLMNLNDVARFAKSQVLQEEINTLNDVLYGQKKTINWQGGRLWHAVAGYREHSAKKSRHTHDLPPMNPG